MHKFEVFQVSYMSYSFDTKLFVYFLILKNQFSKKLKPKQWVMLNPFASMVNRFNLQSTTFHTSLSQQDDSSLRVKGTLNKGKNILQIRIPLPMGLVQYQSQPVKLWTQLVCMSTKRVLQAMLKLQLLVQVFLFIFFLDLFLKL